MARGIVLETTKSTKTTKRPGRPWTTLTFDPRNPVDPWLKDRGLGFHHGATEARRAEAKARSPVANGLRVRVEVEDGRGVPVAVT